MHKLFSLLALAPVFVFAKNGDSVYGRWHGQAQYYVTVGGQPDASANTVINLTIDIDPSGRVVGASSINSCRLLGLALPGVVTSTVSLDVTLSQCQNPDFNRRFSGSFNLQNIKKSFFLIYSLNIFSDNTSKYAIKASMWR